jgi:hypothetical protein
MKKMLTFLVLLMPTVLLFLNGCSRSNGGSEGHAVEQMAIFSLMALTIFAIICVYFRGSKERNNDLPRSEDLIRTASIHPLTLIELTRYPVYIRDSRASFHEMVFDPDGLLFESSSVMENGIDPIVISAGTWILTSDGKVQITQTCTGTTKTYARISENGSFLVTLIQADSGQLEAWYIGPHGLANIQISIFGYSASVQTAAKFTTALVSGRTLYRTAYPGILVNDSGEVKFDPDSICGIITFNDDGTFNKSIDNKIGSTPDYTPSIAGIWHVDDSSGVLTMTVFGYTIASTILLQSIDLNSLLVSTTNGNERWESQPHSLQVANRPNV